jgi:amino acid permease
MNTTNRKTAVIVGVLFIIGTVAGILSAVFTGSTFSDPDYLIKVSENQTQIIIGALCVLIMGFALAMVPVMLFPIFKKHNEALALGAVLFRGALEAFTYIAMVISWLLLIVLSQEYVKAGNPEISFFQTLGTLLLESGDWINQILAIVFSLGALMIYYLFYQSKLIPRWLSIWGLVGGVLYLFVPLVGIFGPNVEILMVPLALQEMVLAVWLIVKGFNLSTNASKTTT